MGATSIEWADKVWNPLGGCSRESPGCVNCYAEIMAARFSRPGQWGHGLADMVTLPNGKTDHRWTGEITELSERLLDPLRWRKPSRIFVNSTSDLFHPKVSAGFIDRVFAVMAIASRHTFIVLTKRADRMREEVTRMQHSISPLEKVARSMGYSFSFDGVGLLPWPVPNIWLGVSVESQEYFDKRWPDLARTPAAHRFISYEPALEAVDFTPALIGPVKVDQIIIGGESGPGARRFDMEWAYQGVDQCQMAKVACFVKQMGGNPFRFGIPVRLKDKKGGDMEEWPSALRVRQM